MLGIAAKNSTASSTSIVSTSPMLLPRQLTASVSALKRCAVADVARHLHVGQEAHLDGAHALPFAGRAAAFAGVEAEARRRVAARLAPPACRRRACGSRPRSRCRWPGRSAASCRSASGRLRARGRSLVAAQPSQPAQAGMRPLALRVAPGLGGALRDRRVHVGQQHVARQRRLAGAADAGDGDQPLQRHVDVERAAGCAATAPRRRQPAIAPAPCASRDRRAARCSGCSSGCARKRPVTESALRRQVGRAAFGHQPAAALAGAGADVDDVVGAADRVFVVLHHDQRVALVAQACAARRAASGCRAGAGRWSARRARSRRPAGCCRAARPGGCAAPRRRERRRGAVQRQVAQADLLQELEPAADLG